jgi:penicillin-binding protein 1A
MLIKNPERSYSRKLHEMVIALKLEWKYSKEEILGAYLNLAYFGERVYGIETAARAYFNKSVTDLSIPEAAMLAGLLKAPSAYSPLKDPALARERMKTVLKEMLSLHNITNDEYASALAAPLPESVYFQRKYSAPYFIDFMRTRLSEKYGEAPYQQGFQIFSTSDTSMQSLAEQSVRDGVRQVELRSRSGVQAALVAMDLATGEIKAMVGGTDYTKSQFNRATMALRQPGSAFKPLYMPLRFGRACRTMTAFLMGLSASGDGYRPLVVSRNSEGEYHGDVSLRPPLRSLNAATVRLAQQIGFERARNG